MRNVILVVVFIAFIQCNSDDKKFILINAEFEDSIYEYERDNKNTCDNLRKVVEDDKTYGDSSETANRFAQMYKRFDEIHHLKDSLIRLINEDMNEEELIGLLTILQSRAGKFYKERNSDQELENFFAHDLNFIRKNIEGLPSETHVHLFKNIIERWAHQYYSYVLRWVIIDDPCIPVREIPVYLKRVK